MFSLSEGNSVYLGLSGLALRRESGVSSIAALAGCLIHLSFGLLLGIIETTGPNAFGRADNHSKHLSVELPCQITGVIHYVNLDTAFELMACQLYHMVELPVKTMTLPTRS